MYQLKTRETDASVSEFIASLDEPRRQAECNTLLALFDKVTGEPAKIWGGNMVGFGRYSYHYASGHQGEWFRTGFAPRKRNLTIYIMPGFDSLQPNLQQLGKYKTAKSCLYINKLDDVSLPQLEQLIRASLEVMAKRYPL